MDTAGERGVIKVGMLAKIRRMHFRDHLPLREIARQTGLSRNTIRTWLRKQDTVEPQYKRREARSDARRDERQRERGDQHQAHRRERRTPEGLTRN